MNQKNKEKNTKGCPKAFIFLCLILIYFCPLGKDIFRVDLAFGAKVTDEYWSVRRSKHFVIYYRHELYPGYIDEVIEKSEYYYREIGNSLNLLKYNFWTWKKRCKIFLYSSQQRYYNHIGWQPLWSIAQARFREREISTYIHGEQFLLSALPQEIAHLLFREVIGYNTYVPLWLDEGVTCLFDYQDKGEKLHIAKGLAKAGLLIPLDQISDMNDPKMLIMPMVFYCEAVSLVDFLLEEFGKEKFLKFCKSIKGMLSENAWKKEIAQVYDFKDLSDMHNKWVEYLMR